MDINGLMEVLGLDEEPMGMYYTDEAPGDGFSPKPGQLPSAEAERKGEVDWNSIFGNFSCVMRHIWLARKKNAMAVFEREKFGCLGGAFYLGFLKPQLDFIAHYISSGIPGTLEGEHYLESGKLKAVLGGWDPSARKYFKTDEITFAVPYEMYVRMATRWPESFLTTGTWKTVLKKVNRSRKAWGESKTGG